MKKYEYLYAYARNLIRAELRGIELTAKSIKRRKAKKDLLLSCRARNLILARAFLLGKNYLQAERKAKISPVPEEISKTIRSYFPNAVMCPTSEEIQQWMKSCILSFVRICHTARSLLKRYTLLQNLQLNITIFIANGIRQQIQLLCLA